MVNQTRKWKYCWDFMLFKSVDLWALIVWSCGYRVWLKCWCTICNIFFSLEYDIQGFKAKGSQVKSLRISSWLTMIIMCCAIAFSASNCPKTRKHSSKWAARLELRVWEIISEGHILKLGETLGKKRGMKRMPRRNPSWKLRPLQRLMMPSASWWRHRETVWHRSRCERLNIKVSIHCQ